MSLFPPNGLFNIVLFAITPKLAVGEEKNSKKANERSALNCAVYCVLCSLYINYSSAIKKLETMSELPNEDAVSVVDMEAESNRETSKGIA